MNNSHESVRFLGVYIDEFEVLLQSLNIKNKFLIFLFLNLRIVSKYIHGKDRVYSSRSLCDRHVLLAQKIII